MRLDQLKFRPGMRFTDLNLGDGTVARVWKGYANTYTISRWNPHRAGFEQSWMGIDPLTAQAVLFDLCSRSDP